MSGFEGSFLGDTGRIEADTLMECGVCWWVYDPAAGDQVWQIAPGTPFAELPDHWRCPNCDAAPAQFMVLDGQRPRDTAQRQPRRAAGPGTLERNTEALRKAYADIDGRMRALPVYNRRLDTAVVGMRRCQHGLICVVTTPWLMHLVLLSEDEARRREGSVRELAFPSGLYRFTTTHIADLGAVETCSLFSPMDAFDDPEVAREVAAHSMEALFTPESPEFTSGVNLSRRQFLRPGAATL